MLRQFVRGYGVLIACSLAILISLLFYQEYKQDVLAYSLDLVGDRLMDMSPKEEDRSTITAIYDAFKERVLAREVPPAQVEHVAANVLNLNRNGAVLTPEQAVAMLEPPLLTLAAYNALIEPAKAVDAGRWTALGDRIKEVCELEKKIEEIAQITHREEQFLKEQVYVECKDGLRVAVDIKLEPLFTEQLSVDMPLLEKKTLVVWRDRLAESLHNMRQQMEKDIAMLADDVPIDEPALKSHLDKLKVLKELSRFDYHLDEIQTQSVARHIKKSAEKHRKRAEAVSDESSS